MIYDNITDLVEVMLNKEMFEYDRDTKCFLKDKHYHSAIGLEEKDNKIFIRVDFLQELISQMILNILEMQKRDIEENIMKFYLIKENGDTEKERHNNWIYETSIREHPYNSFEDFKRF